MMSTEVAKSYQAPLEDLVVNSKPQISMLTMLAEDHEQSATEIVRVIKEQIKKVSSSRKLPIMYLIDSIIKNLAKSSYPDAFANSIVEIFCGVFEEVDETTRSQLYKLRQTWVDILPNKRLYTLDVGVKKIDGNWPITAKPPSQGVIHVNPKFLKHQKEKSPEFSPVQSERSSPRTMEEELQAKEKELQRLRVELEMAEIKNKIEIQKKQLEMQQKIMQQNNLGRKFVPRDPPPSIALPPPPPPPSKPASRDPRLNRDPRTSRDPRLKKQAEEEENVPHVSATAMGDAPLANSLSNTSISPPKMDLASILNSFQQVTAKIVGGKKSPPKKTTVSPASKPVKSILSSKPGPQKHGKESKTENSKNKSKDSDHIKEEKLRNNASKSIENKSTTKDSQSSIKERKGSDSDTTKRADPNKERNSSKERTTSKEKNQSKDSTTVKDPKLEQSENRSRKDKEADKSRPSDRRDSRESRRSPRREHRRSPDRRRGGNRSGGYRDRLRDEPRVPVVEKDGKTDKFGRIVRNDTEKQRSRDRSPVDKDNKSEPVSMKEDLPISKMETESVSEDEMEREDSPENLVHTEVIKKKPITIKLNNTGIQKKSTKMDESNKESEHSDPSQIDIKVEIKTESEPTNPQPLEDIDMRNQSSNIKEVIISPKQEPSLTNTDECQLKRPSTDIEEHDNDAPPPPYKIPKLSGKKAEELKKPAEEKKTEENEHDEPKKRDISDLFGGEDVDYRNLPGTPQPLMIPPPMPNLSLLSPVTPTSASLKSPAQSRWNQYKEQHPLDFAKDMERKRMRDSQLVEQAEDEDLRPQRPPGPPTRTPFPKDLSVDNQKQILHTAEQKLKAGHISPAEHQEIVRQLGEVYDMQRKSEEHRPVDLKADPRLGGMKDRRGAFEGERRGLHRHERDFDQRRPHPYNGPGGPSNRTSPREDFDEQHPPLSGNQEFEKRMGQDFDSRSPFDNHDGRLRGPMRETDDFERRPHPNERRPHPEGRRPHPDDVRPYPREFDEPWDERRPEFLDGPGGRGRPIRREEDQNFRGSPPLRGPPGPRGPGPMRPGFDGPRGPGPVRHDGPRRPFNEEEGLRRPFLEHEGQRRHFNEDGPRRHFDDDGPRRHFDDDGPRRPLHENEGPRRPFNASKKPRPLMETSPPRNVQMPDPVRDQEVVRPLPSVPTGPTLKPGMISDPFEDPRWSLMRGMLESEGTEELVINAKPFELRMGTSRNLKFDGMSMDVAVDVNDRGIRVDGNLVYKLGEPIKEVPAIGKMVRMYYHGLPKPIWLDGQQHEMRRDAPPRNVMVDGERHGFQIDGRDLMILIDRLEKGTYGGPPRKVKINGKEHELSFQAPPRQIFIDQKACKLKLDSKIPCVIIDGKPHGIRFDGEPHIIFINEEAFTIPFDRAVKIKVGTRPMFVAFGGPCHEVIIDGKWFEVKFDNLPKDVHFHNRHYSIRLPGPLPKVKILNEMPADLDESRLLSSYKAAVGPTAPVTGPLSGLEMSAPGPEVRRPFNGPQAMRPMGQGGQPMMQQSMGPGNMMGARPMVPQMQGQMQRPMQGMPTNPAYLANVSTRPPNMQNLFNMANMPNMSPMAGLPNMPTNAPSLPQQSEHSVAFGTGLQGSVYNPQHKPDPSKAAAPPNINIANLLALKHLLPPPSTSTPVTAQPTLAATSSTAPTPTPSAGPVDISSLLNNLLKVGLIKDKKTEETDTAKTDTAKTEPAPQPKSEPVEVKTEEAPPPVIKKNLAIPDLTDFDPKGLRVHRIPVIQSLHEGLQCHMCAARFTDMDQTKYRQHLDWHFRQNKMDTDMIKVARNRKWFYSIMDWIQYQELDEEEDKSRSEIFEKMKLPEDSLSAPAMLRALEGKDVMHNPAATGGQGEDTCATCGDSFDQTWNEETEEWILKDTIRIEGKTYHPVCFEDVSETPTPAVDLPNNPLDDQISDLAVKTEMETEAPSTPPVLSPPPALSPVPEVKQEIKTEEDSEEQPPTLEVSSEKLSAKLEPISSDDKPADVGDNLPDITPGVSVNQAASIALSELSSAPPSVMVTAIAPTLLSTIASTVPREIISLTQEGDDSMDDLDSNPTPELSRTPTPEPMPSFTPVPSLSSESLASQAEEAKLKAAEEEPVPSATN